MSSNRSVSPLQLKPHPSRILRTSLYLAHGLGLLCVGLVATQIAWLGLLLVPLGYSLWHSLGAARQGPTLNWDSGGSWWWQGEEQPLTLAGDSYCSPYLVILNFRAVQRPYRRNVLLLSDSLDLDTWRRLRVRLGLQRSAQRG